MDLNQSTVFGAGASFPIVLTNPKDKDGNPTYIPQNEGGESVQVQRVGWYPISSPELIKQNLISLFVYQLGERIRQEDFGSRLWECVEEENTQALAYLVFQFIKASISKWEPRVVGLKTEVTIKGNKLYIQLKYAIAGDNVNNITLEYEHSTNTIYGY